MIIAATQPLKVQKMGVFSVGNSMDRTFLATKVEKIPQQSNYSSDNCQKFSEKNWKMSDKNQKTSEKIWETSHEIWIVLGSVDEQI